MHVMARTEAVDGMPVSAQDTTEKSIDTTVLFLDTARRFHQAESKCTWLTWLMSGCIQNLA
jgi:hypothetical protein